MSISARLQVIGTVALAGCGSSNEAKPGGNVAPHSAEKIEPRASPPQDLEPNLLRARAKFQTTIVDSPREPAPDAPPAAIRLVKYDASPGKLAAYLTADPGDGIKHPAIVWMTGGDTNSIGDVWSPGHPANDQTARQFRESGVVMMYPSLRGGNDNPGRREGFYGEVDDVLAAADFLASQSYVDPKRVYLGGHSTGGTLALLVAAAAPQGKFRAVFSFGPVHDVSAYGDPNPFCPFDTSNRRELELRSPLRWIHAISTPTFVLEGTEGNLDSLQLLKAASRNPLVRFIAIDGGNHFGILAPANKYLASQIVGPWADGRVQLTDEDVARAVGTK